jgi:hypothetical protein
VFCIRVYRLRARADRTRRVAWGRSEYEDCRHAGLFEPRALHTCVFDWACRMLLDFTFLLLALAANVGEVHVKATDIWAIGTISPLQTGKNPYFS